MGVAKTNGVKASGPMKLKAIAPKVRSNATNAPVSKAPNTKAKGGRG